MDEESNEYYENLSLAMSRRKHPKDPNVQAATPERMRIEIDQIFREFLENPDAVQYEFPSNLNRLQRKYIHDKARKLSLHSKSHGKEPNRTLMICKRKKPVNYECFYLKLSEPAMKALNISTSVPFEMLRVLPKKQTANGGEYCGQLRWARPVQVPPARCNGLANFRKTLPVFSMRRHILDVIQKHRVVIVSSETGSGKTTQIPQFILEETTELDAKCRVICTQPRRISAVAVAERVAAERGEELGSTVGYSIRLESKVGPLTALCYCTNGVLLRTLMHDKRALSNITHVIVDEIHERDKFSDFLMIVLREGLQRNPHLKLILMSATLKTEVFAKYFPNVCTVSIPGRTYTIQELFLDEILLLTQYESRGMSMLKEQRGRGEAPEMSTESRDATMINLNSLCISGEFDEEMDDAISKCVTEGLEEHFDHLIQLIVSEEANVNYQHSETGCTGLMAAAMHGNLGVLEKLLCLGADVRMTCSKNRNACDWAEHCSKFEVLEFLRELSCQESGLVMEAKYRHPAQSLLSDYDKTISDELIDFDLIIHVIKYIHGTNKPGSILVFLPGYDDIMLCQEHLLASGLRNSEIAIFLLHGSMQIGAQHDVFNTIPGKRKIILSTNVAETSITIDDVVFVIDSGRAKEKTYDAISGIGQLQTTWISRACAKQRAGRAGRTRDGLCFHIYSRARYNSMQANRTPEILRVSLHELCLHTKMLASPDTSIAAFLSRAIEPPSSIAVQSAVQSLQALGALDEDENLTCLGEHLLLISAEPHLAKMLIYATVFKCLDPVLTIVSCLVHKDPFVLPTQGKLKAIAQSKRKLLSSDSLSDHMSFIIAFQMWQDAKIKHNEKRFCREYFVSGPTMEMILQSRVQLLSQLRAAGFVQPNGPHSMHCLNEYSESWPVVKASLVVGLYPNLAYVQRRKITTRTESRVSVHTSSCLSKYLDDVKRDIFHNWVVYEELAKIGSHCSIKCATVIAPIVVSLLCGQATTGEVDGFSINIDDWLEFELPDRKLYDFRLKLEAVVNKRIENPYSKPTHYEETIISALHEILSAEDIVINLHQPQGFGKKPKLIRERESARGYFVGTSNANQTPLVNEVRNENISRGRNGIKPANGLVRDPGYTIPAHERFVSPNAEFYITVADSMENLEIAFRRRQWTLSPSFTRAAHSFQDGKEVILLFSVPSAACFGGVARVMGMGDRLPYLNCSLQWLCLVNLPHAYIRALFHPSDEFLPLHFSQDGHWINRQVGRLIYEKCMEVSGINGRGYRPILGSHC